MSEYSYPANPISCDFCGIAMDCSRWGRPGRGCGYMGETYQSPNNGEVSGKPMFVNKKPVSGKFFGMKA